MFLNQGGALGAAYETTLAEAHEAFFSGELGDAFGEAEGCAVTDGSIFMDAGSVDMDDGVAIAVLDEMEGAD
jgi:hypothetical protein